MKKTVLLSALMLAASSSAMALENLSTIPGEPVEVSISQDEFTLFTINDASIVRLDGENFIDNSEKDKGTGNAFIKPSSGKKFTLFIKDSKGNTWPVRITPDAKKMGDVVVIKNASPIKKVKPNTRSAMDKSSNRIQSIKSMMRAMVSDKSPSDMSKRKMSTPIEWWAESDVVLKREYTHKNLKGSVYTLKNISPKKMVMDEQEFYSNGVISIALEKLHLEPQQSTRVFVITENKE